MKKLTMVLIFLFVNLLAWGQSSPHYQAAMTKAIGELWAAKSAAELQAVINQFDRIAGAEKNEWLPLYYAALGAAQASFMEKDTGKRDGYLDKGQQYVDQLCKRKPQESEVHVLQGMVYQGRIQVNPMLRGPRYAGLAEQALKKGQALNPENPRAYFLLAQQKLHMPAMLGGGPEAALPYLMQAKEKFAAFKPENELAPNWGEKTNTALVEKFREKKGDQ
jgi:hypothetical protein